MKNSKLNLLFAILLTFIMLGITNSSISGDKWKVKNITVSNLGGEDDVGFKITLENTGELKSTGEEFPMTVKFFSGSRVFETKTITVNPPKISKGGNFHVWVDCVRPNNISEFDSVFLTVEDHDNNGISVKGIQKSFKIK